MRSDILVTTGDINQDYQIIGPVYFQISNKGIFSNALSKLVKQYEAEIIDIRTYAVLKIIEGLES